MGSFTQWIFSEQRCRCSSADGAVQPQLAGEKSEEPEEPLDEESVDENLVGALIDGRFRVESLLGVGGWGCVVRAWHPDLECPVAVKLLHARFSFDNEKVARFKQEAQAARKLRHPNIVAVHDFGQWDGRPYLVMDFLQGHSLAAEIGSRGISVERFFQLFEPVLAGLRVAHDAGIIHRDLTPSNIFIIDDGADKDTVKILDFGLAKLITADGIELNRFTQTGTILGTPAYMSPEHCMGALADTRSDIYSLGCSMYEALSGRKIFNEETVFGWLSAQVSSTPRPLEIGKTKLQLSLKNLIERCLEKDPDNRPQSTQQVLDALQNMRAGKKLGLARRKLALLPNDKQRGLLVNFSIAFVVLAIAIGLDATFSGPITRNLNSELLKLQGKLALIMPAKREWQAFDALGIALMNAGQFKDAAQQFAVAESTAQADGNRIQQLRTLKRHAVDCILMNDVKQYFALRRQIKDVVQQSGDLLESPKSETQKAEENALLQLIASTIDTNPKQAVVPSEKLLALAQQQNDPTSALVVTALDYRVRALFSEGRDRDVEPLARQWLAVQLYSGKDVRQYRVIYSVNDRPGHITRRSWRFGQGRKKMPTDPAGATDPDAAVP